MRLTAKIGEGLLFAVHIRQHHVVLRTLAVFSSQPEVLVVVRALLLLSAKVLFLLLSSKNA